MAVTHFKRFAFSGFSNNGRFYTGAIYDKNYSSTAAPYRHLIIGPSGVQVKFNGKGNEKFSPIMASSMSIGFMTTQNTTGSAFIQFINNLKTSTYQEGDVTIAIFMDTHTPGEPLWTGNVLLDLGAVEDVDRPYEIIVKATDGIGVLKSYDMVETQGTNPYSVGDTYVSEGYQTFIYWIQKILEYTNPITSDKTDGEVVDWKFTTSVQWSNENFNSTNDPLSLTKCRMDAIYSITNDGLYKALNVYKVLESMCKTWGMRLLKWRNIYYFTQVELYNREESGTFALPDNNFESSIYDKTGAFETKRDYIGNTWFALWEQEFSSQQGGLKRLAGSKWNYYPKLKEVSVDFEQLSDNNYFSEFPKLITWTAGTGSIYFPYDGQTITCPEDTTWFTPDAFSAGNYAAVQIASTSLGTFSGASGFAGFWANICVAYTNTYTTQNDIRTCWGLRAKPAGAADFSSGYYIGQSNGTPAASWTAYPTFAGSSKNSEWWDDYGWSGSQDVYTHMGYNSLTIPLGTSTQTLFSGIWPTHAAFTGDWDFEIFTIEASYKLNPVSTVSFGNIVPNGGADTSTLGGGYDNGRIWTITHGHNTDGVYGYRMDGANTETTNATFPGGNYPATGVLGGPANFCFKTTYDDVLTATGEPVSQFTALYANTIGGTRIATSVTSNRNESAKENVKGIYWGDTSTLGEPASLQWVDGGTGATGYTTLQDPKWRNNGYGGAYDKNLAELLADARLNNQQTNDFKWNMRPFISVIGAWVNDGTGVRPRYINPVGVLLYENIRYYMKRGTFNVLNDEWSGEWIQASEDTTLTTTTTTTTTGGSDPVNQNIAMKYAPPQGAAKVNPAEFVLTTIQPTVSAGAITSLKIIPLNMQLSATTYMFDEYTNIIKTGDKFNVISPNGYRVQFTASANVANNDATISVDSVTTTQDFTEGSKVLIANRDMYMEYQHKTRGTVGGLTVTSDSIGGATKLGRYTISFRAEGSSIATGDSYVCAGEDNTRSGRWGTTNSGGTSTITGQQALKSARFLIDSTSTIESGRAEMSGSNGKTLTIGLYKATPESGSSSDLTLSTIGTVSLALLGNSKPIIGTFGSLSGDSIAAGDLIIPIISTSADSTSFRGQISFTLYYT